MKDQIGLVVVVVMQLNQRLDILVDKDYVTVGQHTATHSLHPLDVYAGSRTFVPSLESDNEGPDERTMCESERKMDKKKAKERGRENILHIRRGL